MTGNNGKSAKSLMKLDVNLGQLTAALGPLAFVVWTGMAWATEIEANIKANQAQIEILIQEVRQNEQTDQHNADRIVEALERLADRLQSEEGSDSADPLD